MAALTKTDGSRAMVEREEVRALVVQFEEISRKQAVQVEQLSSLVARGAARLQETEEKLQRSDALGRLKDEENTGLRQENSGLRGRAERAETCYAQICALLTEQEELREGVRLDERDLAEYRSLSARASRAAAVAKKSAKEWVEQAQEFVDDIPRGMWRFIMDTFRAPQQEFYFAGGEPYSRERYLATRIQCMQQEIQRIQMELDRLRRLREGGEAASPP